MSSNVQQKLFNLEFTPPPGAWHAIADRLHEEFDASETALSQKLQDTAFMPPAASWEAIAAELPGEAPVAPPPAKVVRIPYRRVRMVAAAVVIGLVGLTAWYYLNYIGPQNDPRVVQEQTMTPPVVDNEKPESNNLPPVVAPADEEPREQLAQRNTEPGNRYGNRSVIRQVSYYPTQYDFQSDADNYLMVPEASPVPLTTETTPEVEAPLIRDANGQIILDKKLITSPDNQYITITGPNGEQTRISVKFLDIISTLNADTDPQDYFNFMMYENYLWKIRFSEWRNKLMNQSANMMDILELKEILQEN
jgi:hypothetical protein